MHGDRTVYWISSTLFVSFLYVCVGVKDLLISFTFRINPYSV